MKRPSGRVLGLIVLAAVVGAGLAPVRAGKIYFSRDDASNPALQRSNLDGSGVETLHTVAGTTLALDLQSRKIYWGQSDPTLIGRSNLDGSAAETVFEFVGLRPEGLALDLGDGRLYVSLTFAKGCVGIWRLGLDGTGEESIAPAVCASGLALDPARERLYWAQGFPAAAIRQARLDGTDPETLIVTESVPLEIALDRGRGRIYWTESSGDVLRADLDGSNVETVIASTQSVHGLALDLSAARIYWGERFPNGAIRRASLDGSDAQPILEISTRGAIALDPAGGVDVPATSRTGSIVFVALLLGLSAFLLGTRPRVRDPGRS